jgi:hypothetical protein
MIVHLHIQRFVLELLFFSQYDVDEEAERVALSQRGGDVGRVPVSCE